MLPIWKKLLPRHGCKNQKGNFYLRNIWHNFIGLWNSLFCFEKKKIVIATEKSIFRFVVSADVMQNLPTQHARVKIKNKTKKNAHFVVYLRAVLWFELRATCTQGRALGIVKLIAMDVLLFKKNLIYLMYKWFTSKNTTWLQQEVTHKIQMHITIPKEKTKKTNKKMNSLEIWFFQLQGILPFGFFLLLLFWFFWFC